jgi:hypothetical protein
MGLMVIRHKVRNFANWKPAYDAHAPAREGAGLTKGRVYRSCDDPNEVVVLLDMADVETAKVFAESADLQTAKEQAGVVGMPALLFLDGPVA